MKRQFISSTLFLAVLACLLWSTAFVGVKIGLRFSKPLSFAGLRFICSGLLIYPFCGGASSYFRTVRQHRAVIVIISILQTFLLYGLFYIGMTLISGALGAIIIGASPLVAALTAHYLMPDDEMTVKKAISIGIGLAGVIIISLSRQPWSSAGFKEFLGVVLLLAGSLCSALSNVIVARDRNHINPLTLNSAQIFLGGWLLLLVSLPIEGVPRIDLPAAFYAALAWLSSLSAVAISIWFVLLKRPGVKVSDLNQWKFIIPVVGALLSWTLLADESPDLFSVLGMACVGISILSYNKSAKSRTRYEQLPGV